MGEDIVKLTELKLLSLMCNKLVALPSGMGNMASMTDLNFAENNIESLPEDFGNFAVLKVLELHGNKLTELPESLGNLPTATLETANVGYQRGDGPLKVPVSCQHLVE